MFSEVGAEADLYLLTL